MAPESLDGFREGNRLEAKEALGGLPKSIWETYSAFANTSGGLILLGVKELGDHSLLAAGVPDAEHLVKLFWDGVNNPSNVSCNILVNSDVKIDDSSDERIVIINVPQANSADKPIYLKDNPFKYTYRRNGEGDYRCTEEEVRAMIRDSSDSQADKAILDEVNLDSLSNETIRAYRNDLASARPQHPWNSIDDEEFLLRLEAAGRSKSDDRIHPTSAGLLMFGHGHDITSHFPFYFLDYREVSSTRKWDYRLTSDDGDWSGNVYDFWSRVSVRLASTLPRPYATQELRRMSDTPMHEALREALANMLIHADYHGSVNCVAVRYDDKATFMNPGTSLIPAPVAWAGGVSKTRNPTLMKMFNLVGVGERAGSGFDTMRRGCQWAHVKEPELTEAYAPDRTMLEIDVPQNAPQHDVSPTDAGEKPHGHDVPDASLSQIRPLLDKSERLKRIDVERELGLNRNAAVNLLNKLIAEGVLVKEGSGPATAYRLRR